MVSFMLLTRTVVCALPMSILCALALHEVLEKLQDKIINSRGNTFGQGTTSDMGEHCEVSKAFCNFFLLKCL
uniref:Uncharacterized protein n=1 Tax=Hucho hucho TaxID=62062 RepID=A0A4W5JD88_9TELE